jgi:hypothetical protein
MQATLPPQKFRGVSCFHCGRPIRLRASILWREITMAQREHGPAEQWFSRVFSQRCRMCGGEAVYTMNHISDLEDDSVA